ncbi:MAG: ribosomal protein S18-alanine N-acetyltransferase [Burkholderiales bacterium]|jgi:ribosomal-protein-alanine N-acetyltransferase|nr:ribosomal protein S18-alanine N-acetyltransferase [Burkholderiales bacterium]
MNAQPRETPDFRPMRPEDLPRVMEIERDLYPFPWTEGNFRDSLQAGYSCWVCQVAGHTVGYAVLMLVADEAHVLNIAIARAWQRRGLGSSLMRHLIGLARHYGAREIFLEVRPSNTAARRLYHGMGFNEVARRRNYYPAHGGREDAILMAMTL